jgi:hypothetical protein
MGFAFNRCWTGTFKQLMTPTDEVFLEVGVCLFRDHPREDCPEGFFIVFAEIRQRISPRSGGLPGADLGPRRGEMSTRFSRPPAPTLVLTPIVSPPPAAAGRMDGTTKSHDRAAKH